MLYVTVDIPSILLVFEDKPIESLFIKPKLQNTKILINSSNNSYKSEIKRYLTALKISLDLQLSKYLKILILNYFNVEIKEVNMKLFSENYNLKSLIRQLTY